MFTKFPLYQKAFLEPLNLLALAGLAALTPAFGDPLPLFLAGAGEVAYLLYVPDSRWYANLLHRRAAQSRRANRQKREREWLPFAAPETRSAYAQIELMYTGYLSRTADATPEIAARYEGLLEQYLRYAHRETGFEKQLRELAQVCGVPGDADRSLRDRDITAYCMEQITLCRDLLQSVGSAARCESVADTGRQIALMEERIIYVETASRLREEIAAERAAIETAFVRLSEQGAEGGDTDALHESAANLWAQLDRFAPQEGRVSQLLQA